MSLSFSYLNPVGRQRSQLVGRQEIVCPDIIAIQETLLLAGSSSEIGFLSAMQWNDNSAAPSMSPALTYPDVIKFQDTTSLTGISRAASKSPALMCMERIEFQVTTFFTRIPSNIFRATVLTVTESPQSMLHIRAFRGRHMSSHATNLTPFFCN